jgi:glycosyltransferase involved in cell wall biosynthesis
MKLRVLSVAYPFAPVSTDSIGGAEQVLNCLDQALVTNGHESYVAAAEGSQTRGTLIAIKQPEGQISASTRERVYREVRQRVREALECYSVDLIHMHGIDFYNYIPAANIPVLVTLHLPLEWYPVEAFLIRQRNVFLHGVSDSQVRTCPESVTLQKPIENGVSIDEFTIARRKSNFALCLGRICPEKGYHLALQAAAAAGTPLVLAGKVYPYQDHQNYYRSDIWPRLGKQARFIGPADFVRKGRLLSKAKCLLVPSLVAETSSLVAMEALASGTPVIAFRRGALPEIVEHGRTGFIVDSVDEMSEAIRAVHLLNPNDCRESARARFDLRNTVARYFNYYFNLTGSGRMFDLEGVEVRHAA